MLDELYRFLWEIPFFLFIFCVYLYYRWNLFDECQIIYKASAGWTARKIHTSGVMYSCFLDNVAQCAGQNNLYFIGACLLLGGAGSLFWMVIWAPACVFLRFVQTLILWEEGDGPIGTAHCFSGILKKQMHFSIAPPLGALYGLLTTAAGILGLHCWGVADWVLNLETFRFPAGLTAGTNLPIVPVFLVLSVPLCFLALLGKDRCKKWSRPCLILYCVLLPALILKHFRLVLPALEIVVRDGFQISHCIGEMTGKGQLSAIAAGTALACCLSGLPWDEGIRRYVAVARKADISPVTVGLWAMKEAIFELFLLGGGAGLLLLMISIGRVSPVQETLPFLVSGGWGVFSAVGILLLCTASACLSWNRWLLHLFRPSSAMGSVVSCLLSCLLACLLASFCLSAVDSLTWLKLLFVLLFLPLFQNLLLCLCLSERFRKIMELCKKEIEVHP